MVHNSEDTECYVLLHIIINLSENMTPHKNRQTSAKFGGSHVPKEIERLTLIILLLCCESE